MRQRFNSMSTMFTSLKRVLKGLAEFKGLIVVVLISTVLSTVLTIFGPRELGKATTLIFEGITRLVQGTGGMDFQAIGRVLVWVATLYIISAIFSAIQGYAMITMTETYTYRLREAMMDKINRMPMAYFESTPYGEVLSRIVNDVDTLGASLSQSAAQLLTSVATIIGIGIIMFSMNGLLAILVILIVPVSVIIIQWITRYSQRYFRSQQRTLGVMTGQVEEVYSGLNIVQAFNQEEETKEEFEASNDRMWQDAWRSQFYSGILFPLMRLLSNLGYAMVVIVGAFQVIMGRMSVGEIQAFTQYVNRFTQPISQISQIMNLMQTMAASADRVYEFLDEAEESQTEGDNLVVAEVEGDVTFEHVHFGYVPGQTIIHDFSARVQSGQKVALVGPTGAGKSTIVKLLMRFYDVDGGSIRLDGEANTRYSRQSYQQAMAMVLQDTWLFKGTIMENIRYGRLDASDEEVIKAAKQARVHHFIQSLPGGYHFELSEDAANISQGQRQLLTIARALLADRPVLILDEATSSVDTRTESLIQEAMVELMKGRTSFVIAHRLSTIRDSDLIFYMEDGDIVEQGDHDTLMDLSGRYANLYNSQFAANE
ncbi:multidrug ABC transporter ATP-binding protein [Suicoccus acidiformans]|uniref:Multidrug ABC transporter ATP-binding protein n=1 Tax=Suicoccus acidiformans TaxID=2036206 RepID=A0A347WNF6_9LACT|nr:ABC transporter ATP-binding protein [Suicoccus acidiformans]AXY26613.1 multidrug ABC transporter ATP-binding protein [Suicoccus acidiformans]